MSIPVPAMKARSIGLALLVVACDTRSAETPPAASKETPAPAAVGATPSTAGEPAQAGEAAAEIGPPVAIHWRLAPTRTEGALVLVDAGGARSEVFSAELPLACSAQPARGALLGAQCTGGGATVRISARQAGKEIEISTTATGKKAEVLKRIALPAGAGKVRPQTSPTDAPRAGELLVGWSFAPYRDVHVRVERSEPVPASVEQFIAELVGCPAEAPPPATEGVSALACQHRGRTATLSARRQPGAVTVTHTVSGEGLEQHQVEELVIALPDAAAGAH
jgi:hypothetical protein